MTTQMIIRIDGETKSTLARLAQNEGKNSSEIVRELINNYIKDRDMSSYIDDLWNRVGEIIKSREVRSQDIRQAISQVRKSSE